MAQDRPAPGRVLEDLVLAVTAAGLGALLLWAGTQLGADPRGLWPWAPGSALSLPDLQTCAGLGASFLGLLVLLWWAAGLAAGFIAAILWRSGNPGAARAVGRLSPAFLRRLAAAALGLQLVAVPLPALAGGTENTTSIGAVASSPVDPVWRPSTAGADAAARSSPAADPTWQPSGQLNGSLLIPRAPRPAQTAETVTVAAGDTLWALAAAQLGPSAAEAEISRHWPRWYHLNRSVIGPDPNVIIPGQVLAVPPPPADY